MCLLVVAAQAHAVTAQTPGQGEEIVLVGPRAQAGPADQRGAWQATPGRLALTSIDATREHYFVPRTPEFADGFVRLRIETPRAGKVVLALRATASSDVAGLSGYGVELTRGSMTLVRWDHGRLRPLDRPVPLPRLPASKTVEIEAWLVGPHLGAQVLDGDTLQSLGSSSTSDTTYTHGRTGVFVLARKPPAPAVLGWTVRPARTAGLERRQPAGLHRYLKLAQAGVVPETLRDVLHEIEGGVWRSDARNVERLQRAGVELQLLDVDSPFAWQDAAYRFWRSRPMVPETPDLTGPVSSYRDPRMVAELLHTWAAQQPNLARVVELGRTAQGRPLLALKISNHPDLAEDEPAVLLNGGHHGDELLAIDFALDAAEGLLTGYATDPDVRAWVDGLTVWIVPMVNPDGVQQFFDVSSYAGRKNARRSPHAPALADDGIDLNRNYPFRWKALGELGSRSRPQDDWYRGPRAGSEAETQAMMALADSEHFAAAISYHTLGTVILAPYTTNSVANPEPNDAWALAQALARALPVQPSGRRFIVRKNIYPVDGVDQDWLRAAHGTPALLLEGALQNPLQPAVRQRTIAATRPSWRALLTQALTGPRVSGNVRDIDGKPVTADVIVVEQAPQAGEHWQSRCRDGRFDRLLAKPGHVTLRVTALGQPPVEVQVDATHGPAQVTVTLPFAAQPRKSCAVPELCSQAALAADRAGQCLRM